MPTTRAAGEEMEQLREDVSQLTEILRNAVEDSETRIMNHINVKADALEVSLKKYVIDVVFPYIDSIVKHSQIKPPAEFKGTDELKSTPVDSGAMTSETNLTDSIITNNTNIVNDTAKGSSGGSNHVITSVPDSIHEATETVAQSTDTDVTSGTLNTVTTQTSTNGLQASHVTQIRLRPATVINPKQSRHDVCFSGLHSSTTTDDIRAYLIDIGVANIESIALITGNINSKSACFRVIITDESIKHNVYDPKRYTDGISVLPYRFYKGDKKLQRNTTKSGNNNSKTNSTYTAQRTAAYASVHTDNESNTHGRRGNSPNVEQFSNNKIKGTRKQTRDDRSAVRSSCGPRSEHIPDSISDSHTPRPLGPDYQRTPQTQTNNPNCCAAQRQCTWSHHINDCMYPSNSFERSAHNLNVHAPPFSPSGRFYNHTPQIQRPLTGGYPYMY